MLSSLWTEATLSTLVLRFSLLTIASGFLYLWAYCGYSFWLFVLLTAWVCYLDYLAKRVKPLERQLLRRPLEEKDFRKLPAHLHPIWMKHSNVERVVWLNSLVNQIWPFFRQDLEPQMKQQLTELIDGVKPPQFQHISVSNLSFGDYPVVIEGIEYSIPRSDAFWIDVHFRFGGDIDIELCMRMLHTPSFNINLDDFLIQGNLRIAFEPLVAHSPWFQNIYLTMLETPRIDFSLSAFSKRFDIMSLPLLKSLMVSTVKDALFGGMILPDRMCIPIIPPEELFSVQNEAEKAAQEKRGVIHFILNHVTIDEEQAIMRLKQEGKDTSDASSDDLFLTINFDDEVTRSAVFSPNSAAIMDPSFSENFKFLVSSSDNLGSFLLVNIHSKTRRMFGKPEERLLGSCVVPLSRVLSGGSDSRVEHFTVSPTTFPELKVKFDLEYYPFPDQKEPIDLDDGSRAQTPARRQVQQDLFSPPSQMRRRHLARRPNIENPALIVSPGKTDHEKAFPVPQLDEASERGAQNDGRLSPRGCLFVTVVGARDLVNTDSIRTTDPYTKVKVADQVRYTSVQGNTMNPVWNETFEFHISDFYKQKLFVNIYDEDIAKAHDFLGETEFSISELKRFDRYAFTGEFKLKNVKQGFLKLSLVFRPFASA